MLNKYNLNTLWVPVQKQTRHNIQALMTHSQSTPQCDIYISPDFYENEGKLLCLVQGTGNVRAG
jgi:hypothetical protein